MSPEFELQREILEFIPDEHRPYASYLLNKLHVTAADTARDMIEARGQAMRADYDRLRTEIPLMMQRMAEAEAQLKRLRAMINVQRAQDSEPGKSI